jgi:TRAP-type transport system periplasmic protein
MEENKMKRVKLFSAGTMGLFLLSLIGAGCFLPTPVESAPIVMRIGHAMPTNHGYHIWAEKFKEELSKTMKDRVDVQIFPNGQLGKETEYLEGMRMGTLDASILGRHGQVDIRLEVLNFPMIYRDQKHQDAILRQNSKLQQELDNIFYEKGYKCLGWGVLGDRHVTTKDRAVRKASDLKGLDIRIPNVPVYLAAFKAWGANPTPLDFTEVYSALQQGVIKAQENPPEIIFTSRFYEVQKYLNLTAHSDMPCEFLVGKNYWEKLPKDVQEAILKAATVSRDYHVKVVREANEKLVDELGKKGMIIVRDVDRKSFVPGAEEAYKQFEDKVGKDLIQRVKDAK